MAESSRPAEIHFTNADRAEIARRGLSEQRVRRQLALLHDPPPPAELDRPATAGDGIAVLPEKRHAALVKLHDEAAAAGRFAKMVPASGAATRMFRSLAAARNGGDDAKDHAAARHFLDNVEYFAFNAELGAELARRGENLARAVVRGDGQTVLAALLDADGLAYCDLPKGLVPFHRYREGPRTPFEEHLVEAAHHLRDAEGRCRVHFTVLEQHEYLFRAHWERVRVRLESELDTRFIINYSFQDTSTDTIAAVPDGQPFRDREGHLLFRPGGHGALIGNLERLGRESECDLVFLKNIDNVVPDDRRRMVVLWKKLLGGYLLDLEKRIEDVSTRTGDDFERAATRLLDELGAPVEVSRLPAGAESRHAFLRRHLDRPLRVCGVVPNTGEPGGGPFWVRGEHGPSLQIVEASQIDRDRPEQAAILDGATHFNPVDIVCRLRDRQGRPHELEHFIDPRAVFVSRKSHAGRPLLALEHPGLWNGAMAHWNTVFVEVPAASFAPVKTVLDLLRPEHSTGG